MPPPTKAWPQRTGGLAAPSQTRHLALSRCVQAGPGRKDQSLNTISSQWEAPPASLRGCSPLLSSSGGAQPPLTKVPVVQLSFCSGLASKFSRKQRRDSGLISSLACFHLSPLLHVWGAGSSSWDPIGPLPSWSRRPPTSSASSTPLAQHPIGVHTYPLGFSRIHAGYTSLLCSKKAEEKRGRNNFFSF